MVREHRECASSFLALGSVDERRLDEYFPALDLALDGVESDGRNVLRRRGEEKDEQKGDEFHGLHRAQTCSFGAVLQSVMRWKVVITLRVMRDLPKQEAFSS